MTFCCAGVFILLGLESSVMWLPDLAESKACVGYVLFMYIN